ncbi:MAG: crosslink repair DNA glycosylase YcaQ family protein [Opitutaceae bacterium]
MPPALSVTPLAARRFMRRALLLDASVPDIATALAHHGYIQIDPINVCGRMHDLILRNRVTGYREGDLMRHLHGDSEPLPAAKRRAFEHHLPDTHVLVAFPLSAWPHLLAAMRGRKRTSSAWSGKLTPRERELATRILGEIAQRGPLSPADIDDVRRGRRAWGAATLAKATLQKLFFHGQVLIAQRDHNRRVYDLPNRVLTAATLAQPEPSTADTARWSALLKLKQRRLTTLKRAEFALVEDAVQPVTIGHRPTLYILREDLALLLSVSDDAVVGIRKSEGSPPLLLAPLDPLIYDRPVSRQLWQFDYTWEVYTPLHQRVRGYYALPILAGHELVGHVDLKADRVKKKLTIVSRSVRRGHKAAPAITQLANWLGLRR